MNKQNAQNVRLMSAVSGDGWVFLGWTVSSKIHVLSPDP